MNKDVLISVIIPAYNAEKYIENCIQSLLHQSYKTFEIIIVNDGSTDRTQSICEQLQALDSRIVLINQSNKGVSASRNTGITHAKGEYVSFVDSDDFVGPDFLSSLVSITDAQTDVVCSGVNDVLEADGKLTVHESYDLVSIAKKISLCDKDLYYYFYVYYGTVWGKLIRKSLLSECAFDTSASYGEDCIFWANLLPDIRCVKATGEKNYNYRIDSVGSVLHSGLSKKDLELINNMCDVYSKLSRQNMPSIGIYRIYTAIKETVFKCFRESDSKISKKTFAYIKSKTKLISKKNLVRFYFDNQMKFTTRIGAFTMFHTLWIWKLVRLVVLRKS